MLVGRFENSIDEKNRMIVPAKFREDLGGKCVAAKGFEHCIEIFPVQQWEKRAEELDKMNTNKKKVRQLHHHFYSSFAVCEIDKQGRLTIPQELRVYGKIEKELVTIGHRTKMVVWDKQELKREENSLDQTPEELAESIDNDDL